MGDRNAGVSIVMALALFLCFGCGPSRSKIQRWFETNNSGQAVSYVDRLVHRRDKKHAFVENQISLVAEIGLQVQNKDWQIYSENYIFNSSEDINYKIVFLDAYIKSKSSFLDVDRALSYYLKMPVEDALSTRVKIILSRSESNSLLHSFGLLYQNAYDQGELLECCDMADRFSKIDARSKQLISPLIEASLEYLNSKKILDSDRTQLAENEAEQKKRTNIDLQEASQLTEALNETRNMLDITIIFDKKVANQTFSGIGTKTSEDVNLYDPQILQQQLAEGKIERSNVLFYDKDDVKTIQSQLDNYHVCLLMVPVVVDQKWTDLGMGKCYNCYSIKKYQPYFNIIRKAHDPESGRETSRLLNEQTDEHKRLEKSIEKDEERLKKSKEGMRL